MAGGSIRRYHPLASSTLSIAQLGFEILIKPYGIGGTVETFTPPEGYIYKAIISINGVGRVQANWASDDRRVKIHDDFAKDGTYKNPPANSNNMFLMVSGDAVFGRFDAIDIWRDQVATSNAYFKAILAPINISR